MTECRKEGKGLLSVIKINVEKMVLTEYRKKIHIIAIIIIIINIIIM